MAVGVLAAGYGFLLQRTCEQQVVCTLTAVERVGPGAVPDFVVAIAPVERVVAVAALDLVVATQTVDGVVAAQAMDFVVLVGAGKVVVARCSVDYRHVKLTLSSAMSPRMTVIFSVPNRRR